MCRSCAVPIKSAYFDSVSPSTWLFAIIAVVPLLDTQSRAEFIFLGPTEYFSKTDSPFPVDGSNPSFFLEDFEDGLLNSPGIFQPLLPITHATVVGPSQLTDSVDADDGVIDGYGRSGHSMASTAYTLIPTDPPFSWSDMRFGFDRNELGFYPNSFGFVWTDGVAPSSLLIEVFDSQFQLLAQHDFAGLGIDPLTGETGEDRFLGVVSSTPFAYVQLTSKYQGLPYAFEVDHIQYGVTEVSEPASIVLLLAFVFVFSITYLKLTRRVVEKSQS